MSETLRLDERWEVVVIRTTASAALLLVVLAGCAPTPPPGATPVDPRPTPTGTSTPIPVPTPTVTLPAEDVDPLDTVTTILLQSEEVWFCDDTACGVDGFSYEDDPAEVVAKLTAVFGVEPTAASYDGSGGSTGYDYSWGEGFRIYFTQEDGRTTIPVGVSVTVAEVAGVAVETLHGVRVGTPWEEAVAVADRDDWFAGETDDVHEAWFDTIIEEHGAHVAVIAFGENGGTVVSLDAPISTLVYS